MSAIEANPRVSEGINMSHGTAAKADTPLESARINVATATEKDACKSVIRLTKITLILPNEAPEAYIRVVGKSGGM